MAYRSTKAKSGFMNGLRYLEHLMYSGEVHSNKTILNRRFEFGKDLYYKDILGHFGCVNAVEFSDDGQWLVSGGDDKRVLLWNVNKTLSNSGHEVGIAMRGEHVSNIFCLALNQSQKKIFSAGNDEQVIVHDAATGTTQDVFLHNEPIYGLSIDPTDGNVFASACDGGKLFVWDLRQTLADPFVLSSCGAAYHAVMHNPVEPRYLATANSKNGVYLWDMRMPKEPVKKYGLSLLSEGAMSVRFNSQGTRLLALRRRSPAVLYETTSAHPVAEFDHSEYYNSCTMKSCCFAGDREQYVWSGSDDFKLYGWRIPDSAHGDKTLMVDKAQYVLRGHRSIVNQVRYNSAYGLMASSGVEKVIKLWSSFPLKYVEEIREYVKDGDHLRKVYSHEEYFNLVLETGQFMTHDYSHHSVAEDPRMMAFFDSLVQRDIEGWASDSSVESDKPNVNAFSYEVQSVHSSSTDEEEHNQNESSNPESKLSENRSSERRNDPSRDRISMMIVQKRKQQMAKNVRASLRLEKKKYTRFENACHRAFNNGSSAVASQSGTSVGDPRKDKRKLLLKRAKLSKDFLEDSSDSDSESTASSKHNGEMSKTIPKPFSDIENTAESENSQSSSQCNNKTIVEISVNDPKADIASMSGNEQHPNNFADPTSNVGNPGQSKNISFGNHKKNVRNYRKRKADEEED